MNTINLLKDILGKDMTGKNVIREHQLKLGKSFEKTDKVYRHIIESLVNHSSDISYANYIKKRYLELDITIQNTRYDTKLAREIMWFYERGIINRLAKPAGNYIDYKRSLVNLNRKIDSYKDKCDTAQIRGVLTRLNKRMALEEEMLTEYENYIKDTIENYIMIMIKCSSK